MKKSFQIKEDTWYLSKCLKIEILEIKSPFQSILKEIVFSSNMNFFFLRTSLTMTNTILSIMPEIIPIAKSPLGVKWLVVMSHFTHFYSSPRPGCDFLYSKLIMHWSFKISWKILIWGITMHRVKNPFTLAIWEITHNVE